MALETKCVKIRLKSGALDRVRAWAQTINERRDEALETLRDEGVVIESVFLDSTADGDFLIYYMRAESFDRADEVVQKSVHAIDAYHREFKRDTWIEREELKALIDLDRIQESKT
ncbi:MAG: DUF6176 family protein [Pyrinomonadaceae bacterium]